MLSKALGGARDVARLECTALPLIPPRFDKCGAHIGRQVASHHTVQGVHDEGGGAMALPGARHEHVAPWILVTDAHLKYGFRSYTRFGVYACAPLAWGNRNQEITRRSLVRQYCVEEQSVATPVETSYIA